MVLYFGPYFVLVGNHTDPFPFDSYTYFYYLIYVFLCYLVSLLGVLSFEHPLLWRSCLGWSIFVSNESFHLFISDFRNIEEISQAGFQTFVGNRAISRISAALSSKKSEDFSSDGDPSLSVTEDPLPYLNINY